MAFYRKLKPLEEQDFKIFLGQLPEKNVFEEDVEKKKIGLDRKEIYEITRKKIHQKILNEELKNLNFNNLSEKEFQKLLKLTLLRSKYYKRYNFKLKNSRKFTKRIDLPSWNVGSEKYFENLLYFLRFCVFYVKPILKILFIVGFFFSIITGKIFFFLPSWKYLTLIN